MIDAKRLLDAIVGGSAQGGPSRPPGVEDVSRLIGQALEGARRRPAASAAGAGLAGLLLTSRRGRELAGGLAGLGGLALIGGLAYRAYRNHQAGRPLVDAGAAPAVEAAFDPATATEDDAILYLRTMVAAATADGQVTPDERARIVDAVERAGLGADAARWLDAEIAAPLTVDDIADRVRTPEKAAQVYAAARLAIDPNTLQEREFLRLLAEALDLDPGLRAQIDDTAAGVKVGT